MLPTLTMDTNCVIDIEDDRTDAVYAQALLRAHDEGRAKVAIVAIAASENAQPGRTQPATFSEFEGRLAALGLTRLELLLPVGVWDVTFWGQCLWGSPEIDAQLAAIHQVLFPNFSMDRTVYADDPVQYRRWKSRLCDVLTFWAHVNNGRDIFVTNDGEFHKQTKCPRLEELGSCKILHPHEAAKGLG